MSDFDYGALLKKEPVESPEVPLAPETDNIFPAMVSELRKSLLANGHDRTLVDNMAARLPKNSPDLFWDQEYDALIQNVTEPAELAAWTEANKIWGQMQSEGLDTGVEGLENLRTMFSVPGAGAKAVNGLAESREWTQDLKDQLADTAADVVTGGATNFTLGLGLLDVVARFDKSILFHGVLKPVSKLTGSQTEAELAQLENEIMPAVTIGEGDRAREFNTSTSASLWLMAQKAYGHGESLSAALTAGAGSLVKLVGNEPLGRLMTELGVQSKERSEERGDFVSGQVPALIAGMGRHLSWSEIVERSVPDGQAKFDTVLGGLNDAGFDGKKTMAAIALVDAFGSVFAQPSLAFARGIGSMPTALRGLTNRSPLLARSVAKATSTAATRTYKLEDAVDGVKSAERYYTGLAEKVDRAVTESVATTGKASVRSDLYKRMVLARRHLNNQKQFKDSFREPTLDEVLVRAPRRSPKALPPPKEGGFSNTIRNEMYQARRKVLDSGAGENAQWDKLDDAAFQQRSILGPDDAEISGDALDVIIRTGGLGVDDVTIKAVAPEYYITPSFGPIGTIPWRDAAKAADVVKAERNFIGSLKGLPGPGAEKVLEQSSLRSLIVQEDIIRRNLGVARQIKNKPAIKLYETHLKLNRDLQAKSKVLPKEAQLYEDLLPPEQPGIMSTPERFNKWLEVAGDRVVRSLYPGAMRVGYWHSGIGRIHNQVREPQRFYEELDPEMWNKIRSSRLRHDQSVDAWTDMVVKNAEKAGVISMRKSFNPAKHWAPYKISKVQDEQLFNMLDTVKGTEEFAEASKATTPAIRKMHDDIREMLELAADSQGIKGTDRYLTGYIRHFFTKDQFKGGARPLEYVGLPKNVQMFASHLETRAGNKGYNRSAMEALEVYGRSMHRKTILEPMFQDITANGAKLAKQHKNPAIATYANDYVSTLEGKPTMLGHSIDEWIGQTINGVGGVKVPFSDKSIKWKPNSLDRTLMGFTSAMYAGILTGNPRYPFMQIATAIPTTSMRFGLFRTSSNIWAMATREGQALAKSAGTYKAFSDIFESPSWQKASRMATETLPTITPVGIMTNAAAERSIRGITFHAAIDMHLTKQGFATWPEAVEAGMGRSISYAALRSSEEVNHMFGAHGRSPFLTRKLGGSQGLSAAATQFLSFTWKQSDELLKNMGKGGAGGSLGGLGRIGEYMAVSGWLSSVAAQQLGIDATKYVGLGYLPQDPDEVSSPAVDATMNLVRMASAHSTNDPEKIQKTTRDLIESLDNLIPLMNAYETASKAAQRLNTGDLQTAGGEKLRPLDFKATLPEDLSQVNLQDLARSIRPEGAPMGNFGGELIPTITGQRNIKETLTRRGFQAQRQEDKRFYYNARKAVDSLSDALDEGDELGAAKFQEELENVYRIRLGDVTSMLERRMQVKQISRSLRLMDPALGGNAKMFDRNIKIFREHGIGLEN